MGLPIWPVYTRGSAIAEGPRDALVSRNSATTKYPYHVELFCDLAFSHFNTIPECDRHTRRETDGQIHDDGTYYVSIASRGKNGRVCRYAVGVAQCNV